MLRTLKFITVFFFFPGVNSQEEDGFSNFLTMAMQDYPAWVISQGLDPTPIIPDSLNITTSKLNIDIAGEIKNQQDFNYSNFDTYEVDANIFSGTFEIRGYLRNFSVHAEYDVSGKVFESVPVTGSGAATLISSRLLIIIRYTNFSITEDGYIDLSAADYYYRGTSVHDVDSYFENFSAGGYEYNVKSVILEAYKEYKEWLPVPKHIHEYLTGLFDRTPISEIIRTTLPPTTTTTPTPPPTCPPPGESAKDPKFSRTVYESYLSAWPQKGDQINMGIRASISDSSPLQYQLISRYPVVEITETQNLNFTNDVAEGTYVGPNNVMVMEVIAEVVGDPGRQNSAAVFIVFPKSCSVNE